MNTVFLVIWLQVNGTSAMVHQPVDNARCEAIGASLKLPAGSSWDCATPDEAANYLIQSHCHMVGRDELMDQYTCRKGF